MMIYLFQSTHPVWGGTQLSECATSTLKFQSTHPVWGGTAPARRTDYRKGISIHPPRVGWDGRKRVELLLLHNFNPPTPCGVGPANGKSAQCSPTFQSTHPVWGGTYSTSSISICPDFNPPTPCGVGLPGASPPVSELPHFNPPTPCGVGHFVQFGRNSVICISIHPPRVGWDLRRRLRLRDISLHFNPPTPCGVGPHNTALSGGNHDFNPPTPCGVGLDLA